MNIKRTMILVFAFMSINIFSQDIGEKIKSIIEFLNRNNLSIFKDGTILSNNRINNQYINELVQRIGKSNNIEFIIRTKKSGLYKAIFMINDAENRLDGKLLGNLIPISEKSGNSSTLYPIESLDTITLVFRYKEKEDLLNNDLIYLLNSMLYKDETLTSMIKGKIANNENQSEEDKNRLVSMSRDLLQNKKDIIDVSNKVINNYIKENTLLKSKSNKTPDDEAIISENQLYIDTYNALIENMKKN
ncbi:MAG: hypothetical protein A2015_08995 [Spirochaetes bacterium GWF1_31_7]|nr:MAG: hypothetical protein A2Y30_09225 [Spirochaetes bacterium GWE1_32_154]OHD46611.1 MAG: hypothetical protein A2Y29_07630 [Spirochaetes bacterium GWE2_31_10]OHD47625.1 MAG: hypothetical protein A2015_08995 [Spirochaetes bacterium GWF1_31_7]HBD94402.1 hypothetical protein [Spirochaetia bacterium]HBI37647.1 hypothetical protein [Spirochaetia bacterium]